MIALLAAAALSAAPARAQPERPSCSLAAAARPRWSARAKEPEATDPGRGLTPGETAMAHGLFGAGIGDYSAVRVFNRRWIPWQDATVAPDGNIYYPPGSPWYRADMALEAPQVRRHFMHEMAHVYQFLQGMNVVGRRLAEGGVYDYSPEPGKSLEDYLLEQQAEILADHYLCRGGEAPSPVDCSALRGLLARFLEDPSYLREAERERLRRAPAPTP